LRKREIDLNREYDTFLKERDEKLKIKKEELFLLDVERKREEASKNGKTYKIK
jgi:hypothetical protein